MKKEAIDLWYNYADRYVKAIAMSTFIGEEAESFFHELSYLEFEIDQLHEELKERHNGNSENEPMDGED